jgi:hypothetical protein
MHGGEWNAIDQWSAIDQWRWNKPIIVTCPIEEQSLHPASLLSGKPNAVSGAFWAAELRARDQKF